MQRRELLLRAMVAASVWRVPAIRAAAGAGGYSADRYSGAIVIDALGGPGGFHPGQPDDAPLTDGEIADVRQSGLTAVNVTVNEVGNGPGRYEKTVKAIGLVEREIAAHPDVFLKVLRASDLTAAKRSRRLGLIYGFQDSSMLDGDLARIEVFHNLGLRIAQPTYNLRNLMGDGCLEEADGGLSHLGYELIAELNRLRIVLDLSHAGRRVITEGIHASRAPMAITHTGCRALADLPRNTDDAALKALADRGGVAGIYFMPFLRPGVQVHSADVIRHLEHAVQVCGEDHVGVGTDGAISAVDTADVQRTFFRKRFEDRVKAGVAAPGESPDLLNRIVPEYNSPQRFLTLADDLAKRGWRGGRIDKVLGANFARLFTEVWG